ncbi:MAG TPA: Fe-S cluster assembly protein HesB [Actinobacteria bacterium]|nr:Fe-S cluster assembly protein HesB [Actinomycetota bacterium]
MPEALPYTHDPEANRLLAENPFALLVGLVLQQQVPVERAFAAPAELERRLGGLDVDRVVATSPEALQERFAEKPALHRFPGTMAKRVQEVARFLLDRYDGDVAALWRDVEDADELLRRLEELPGFGEYKARILLAILAKHFGVRPRGYERWLPDWPSIADVERPEDLEELKVRKKEWKARQG